jgi:hypothetical protein
MAESLLPTDVITAEEAQIIAAFNECIAKMLRANEQMARDETEIERLKNETRAILNNLKAA